MTIIVTNVEFSNSSFNTHQGKPESTQIEYAEWNRDGVAEYAYAIIVDHDYIDTIKGEVRGIPLGVRQAIAEIVLKDKS